MARQKTGGRQKGTPNKTTASVKQALIQAFDDLGGVESLVLWGSENPTQFYQLWAKILPQEVHNTLTGADGGPLATSLEVVFGGTRRAT